ncbi:adipokinetic hormone/corazonin-related peptide receptor variant I-like [Paramacrobiotus metropolitanus]|uniref:adipokinetic hormone/corazonin-related peptide receptor variant I-like n=1 Tax=Paramacrobiotus metropolitanus TaxID=2943436 RepID=UPI002445D3B2|nr:adipokinetic hormone/corazonin-related peptide receptor variant I-like [Paramacrobiotus metropolitanus]
MEEYPSYYYMADNASELLADSIYNELMHTYNNGTFLTFIVLLLGLVTNFGFLWLLVRRPLHNNSRLRPFLINLAVADLTVCFFTISLELGWRLTIRWTAGDLGCRFFSTTKTIGLYSEAFVVLAMSLDRCYVVMFPLRRTAPAKRRRILLSVSWAAAVIFSLPQGFIFHLEYHPDVPEFAQCVTLNTFPDERYDKAYVIIAMLLMYVIPLIIILIVSILLLWTIRKPAAAHSSITNENSISGICSDTYSTNESIVDQAPSPKFIAGPPRASRKTGLSPVPSPNSVDSSSLKPLRTRLNTGLQLCHSDTVVRRRARSRTLKLSILIVVAFILCYTPYTAMITTAFVSDSRMEDTLQGGVDSQIMEALLMLSLSFSTIMNPLVYGCYMLHTRRCHLKPWWKKCLQRRAHVV